MLTILTLVVWVYGLFIGIVGLYYYLKGYGLGYDWITRVNPFTNLKNPKQATAWEKRNLLITGISGILFSLWIYFAFHISEILQTIPSFINPGR